MFLGAGWLILSLLPPAWLWREMDSPIDTFSRGMHVLLAAPLYLYAIPHSPRIVQAFRSVQTAKDTPERLLTDGYYARIRHPFYAMNILSISALMFALGSVYSIVLGILLGMVFCWNGYFDERQ